MQPWTQAAYLSVSAWEPSPWSQLAAHSVVALTWLASGLGTWGGMKSAPMLLQ